MIGHVQFGHASFPPVSFSTSHTPVSGQPAADGAEDEQNSGPAGASSPSHLTEQERKEVEALSRRDREVRAHEQAHAAAAGALAQGGPTYEFERGPDGRMYAVGGEVNIDTSAVPGDPQATLEKAEQIRRAALAPADPSSQDRSVAADAAAMAAQARVELAEQRSEIGHPGESQHELNAERSKVTCAVCGGEHPAAGHDAVMAYGGAPGNPTAVGSGNLLLNLSA